MSKKAKKKDLSSISHSIFVVAIGLVIMVGVGVIIAIANSAENDSINDSKSNPEEFVENVNQEPGSRRITGVVTEIFNDCSNRLILEDGEVVESTDAISCDGGSILTLNDDQQILFSSGFVPSDQAFEYDLGELMPGDTAEVVYEELESGIGTLNCDECEVRILQ